MHFPEGMVHHVRGCGCRAGVPVIHNVLEVKNYNTIILGIIIDFVFTHRFWDRSQYTRSRPPAPLPLAPLRCTTDGAGRPPRAPARARGRCGQGRGGAWDTCRGRGTERDTVRCTGGPAGWFRPTAGFVDARGAFVDRLRCPGKLV